MSLNNSVRWLVIALCYGVLGAPMTSAAQTTIRTTEEPLVSQPPPFSSGGKTVIVPRTRITVGGGRIGESRAAIREIKISGRASVIDGDTLRIEGRRIHLYGIDAVEDCQICRFEGVDYPCGIMATAKLVELSLGKAISCRGQEMDRDGELSAICRTDAGELNEAMVAQGWALAYVKKTPRYAAIEMRARKAGAGLWRGEFVRPWVWRIKH